MKKLYLYLAILLIEVIQINKALAAEYRAVTLPMMQILEAQKYFCGEKVKCDVERAFKLATMAAEQNSDLRAKYGAINILAMIHLSQNSKHYDQEKARKLLIISAKQDILPDTKASAQEMLKNLFGTQSVSKKKKKHKKKKEQAKIAKNKDNYEKITAHGKLVASGVLLDSAETGDLKGVRSALKNGADIEAKQNTGRTALVSAAGIGDKNLVEFLLNNRANIESKDNAGYTALILSAAQGHYPVSQFLISRGADVNNKDDIGMTTLMFASGKGIKELVKLLLYKEANIDAKSKEGWTPLIISAFYGNKDVLELLLKSGADINAKDNEKKTAAMRAKEKGYKEIDELLKKWLNYKIEYKLDKRNKFKNLNEAIYLATVKCLPHDLTKIIREYSASSFVDWMKHIHPEEYV